MWTWTRYEEKYLILIGGNNELLPFVTIIEQSTAADGINIDIRKIPITPYTREVVSTLIGD